MSMVSPAKSINTFSPPRSCAGSDAFRRLELGGWPVAAPFPEVKCEACNGTGFPSIAVMSISLPDRREGPLPDSCTALNRVLFNYLVGDRQQSCGKFQSKRFRCHSVEHQLKFYLLIERNVAGLGALQYLICDISDRDETHPQDPQNRPSSRPRRQSHGKDRSPAWRCAASSVINTRLVTCSALSDTRRPSTRSPFISSNVRS
jgi:hypothetical protein